MTATPGTFTGASTGNLTPLTAASLNAALGTKEDAFPGGVIPSAVIPSPGTTTLGGVLSATAPVNNFQTGVSNSGAPTFRQPQAADVSGLAPSATIDTTSATNITSGTLPIAQLPAGLGGPNVYAGTWNASTGVATKTDTTTVTIASGVGTPVAGVVGATLITATAGTTSIDGVSSWLVGDWIVWSGSHWQFVRPTTAFVPITGGTVASLTITSGSAALATITDGGGGIRTTLDARLNGYASVTDDGSGNITEAIAADGTHIFGKVAINNGSATLGSVVISSGTASFSYVNGGGAALQTLDNRITGYVLVADDGNGNFVSGITADGTYVFSKISVLGSMALAELLASEVVIGSDLIQPTDKRVPGYAWWLDDGSGNIALGLDDTGILRGYVAGGSLDNLITKSSIISVAKPDQRHIRRFRDAIGTTATSGQTWHLLMALAGDFEFVRLVYTSDTTAVQTVIASIAAPAQVNDNINPLDGSGNPLAWTSVTFNNGGSDADIWQQMAPFPLPTPVFPFNLNPRPAGGSPVAFQANTYSDWMQISSLPRTDVVGGLPLIMARTYVTGTPRPIDSAPTAAWDAVAGGRIVRAYVNAGDCVTTPANFISTTLQATQFPTAVEFITRAKGVTIAVVGDSEMEGNTTVAGGNNFAHQTCVALQGSSGLIFEHCNLGQTSMELANFLWDANNLFVGSKPHFVVIQASSRAGPGYATPATAIAQFGQAVALAQRVKAWGGIPILYAPPPDSSESAPNDLNRLLVVAAVHEYGASGGLIIDASALVGVAGTPMTLNPAFTTDFVHPNDVGHNVIATQGLIPIVKSCLGL